MTLSSPSVSPVAAGSYPEFDVVLRSTVSLDRNVEGTRFPNALDAARRRSLGLELCAALRASGFVVAEAAELDPSFKSVLAERELYSRPYLLDDANAVALCSGRPVWATINDNNHLSLHASHPGLDTAVAWHDVSTSEDALLASSGAIRWAFDADIGYIMSEAGFCGTALAASVLIHAPALVISGLAETAFKRAMEAGFMVSGAYSGLGASAGSLFELSLPAAYHDPERATLARLDAAARALAEYERRARQQLLRDSPWDILDIIGRALGNAQCAWLLTRDEAADIISGLRLGIACGALDGMDLATVGELWISLRIKPPSTDGRPPQSADNEPETAKRARALRHAAANIGFSREVS
jgi:protein arginine kinase